MRNNLTVILEVVWFVLGGLMLYIAVDETLTDGFTGAWYYYLLAILAFLMYYFRRRMRITNR